MNLREFCSTIESKGLPSDWIIGDLSMGAWRSHSLALDFGAQLGVDDVCPPEPAPALDFSAASGPSYADLVGHGIDSESSGNRMVIGAAQRAAAIAARLSERVTFVVIPPLFGMPFEAENEKLLRFLERRLAPSGSRIMVLSNDSDAQLNAGSQSEQAHLVPGVIGPEPAGYDAAGLLPLRKGYRMVHPACRSAPGNRFVFDRLAARSTGWLCAYAQYYGNNLHVDPWFLCAEAWMRFAEGACTIALRLIVRAASVLRAPAERAIVQAQAQGMRIAAHRFDEAATGPEASPAVPRGLRAFLLESKGWGLTVTGETRRAGEYLQSARSLIDTGAADREYLYLLNIAALCSLKAGDADESLRIEREIEARLEASCEKDFRLAYVNSINLARLYRRTGDLESARRCYERAFSTTWGVRSEFDCVYTNACMARLEADCGHPAEEFLCWFRAALHWAAIEVPDALGTRAAGSILGKTVPLGSEIPDLAEEVASSLVGHLLRSAADAGVLSSTRYLDPPAFRSTRSFNTPPEWAFGAPGWSVLGSREKVQELPGGPRERELRGRLGAILKSYGVDDYPTFLIDDRFGREMPITRNQLLELSLRLHIPRMMWAGEGHEINISSAIRLRSEMRAALSPAVRSLHRAGSEAYVEFKRRLPRRTLSAAQAEMAGRLEDAGELKDLTALGSGGFEVLRDLQRNQIAEIYLSETTYDSQRLVSTCV